MTAGGRAAEGRERFIPVRKSEIVDALLAEPKLADPRLKAEFRQFCKLIASVFHYEHFEELERLKEAYFHFNPHHRAPPTVADDAACAEFLSTLRRMLARANFVEVSEAELENAARDRALFEVQVRAVTDRYRHVLFFRRGRHREEVERREWMGLRARRVEVEVYDDVVMVAALRPDAGMPEKRLRWARSRPTHRPGSMLIKCFRDIPAADLDTLLPEVRVVMGSRDKWLIGVPAIFGGIPLLIKLGPTLAVLAIMFGIGFGAGREIEGDSLEQALVVTSGLLALGGFIGHQWLKYQRKVLRYQLEINGSLYFRNVSNNAGIFDAIVGAAGDEECKEALLAYFFLLGEPQSRQELDARVEAWLAARFGVSIDFEIDDGLAKLERFGLLVKKGERLCVPPVADALGALDRIWDGYFAFPEPPSLDARRRA